MPEALKSPVLHDLLQEGLNLVICGSAVGQRSAQVGQYYAGPGNKFWRTLARVGLTPRQLQASEAHLLPSFGIGLTDLVKSQSGSDQAISFTSAGAERLRTKILRYQARCLCFNGKRAAQEYFGRKDVGYGLQQETVGSTAIFVAPSTSAAANGSWDISWWEDLARRVQRGTVGA